jgi:DeoR/GlpR family transcriptional regulator of sugar metabolism
MIAESAFLRNTWRHFRQISKINPNPRTKEDDMSISKRQEEILELLNEHNFLTVERLSSLTYTSPSSIRRDLTHLQNLSLIKRTHGGASIFNAINQSVPLNSRMSQNIIEKRGKKAMIIAGDRIT